ncbi:hypothetical protein FNYG_13772 [Fusarium nygamai]|uniref:FAD linked oxidase N-terminal domain-containing protein n=1 Tax=Gibberella nygamai TaxID=42673 RepID=A0A2K0UUQ8_GIBNY|nr:hypothetical protein FNYG_13772 [Fusarium nygamai]
MADFNILSSTLSADQIILKGKKGYEEAINIGNLMYRYTTPAAVVKAKSINDVRSTIVFARKNNLRVTVKNGGHSYMGWNRP